MVLCAQAARFLFSIGSCLFYLPSNTESCSPSPSRKSGGGVEGPSPEAHCIFIPSFFKRDEPQAPNQPLLRCSSPPAAFRWQLYFSFQLVVECVQARVVCYPGIFSLLFFLRGAYALVLRLWTLSSLSLYPSLSRRHACTRKQRQGSMHASCMVTSRASSQGWGPADAHSNACPPCRLMRCDCVLRLPCVLSTSISLSPEMHGQRKEEVHCDHCASCLSFCHRRP